MDEETRHNIYCEAVRLGDEILSNAISSKEGKTWGTILLDDNLNMIWDKSEIIYSGVSWIVLFLLELFNQTQKEKYLNAAIEGTFWIEKYCQSKPSNHYSFFTGRLGVSYTMMRVAKITEDTRFIEKALKVAEPCAQHFRFLDIPNDLIAGTAGILLGLLHLHAVTEKQWIINSINFFIDQILEK